MKRVGFLFNHDAPHQAAHLAGIMAALSDRAEVIAFVRPAVESVARALTAEAAGHITWRPLALSRASSAIAPIADALFPFSRLAALRDNLAAFRDLDLIVSTERTCLRLKDWLGPAAPRLVFVPHGAGDRNVTYHPDLARFDLWLVAGPKVIEAGTHFGVIRPGGARIIGYPKFDAIDLGARPRLFENDNPVMLYNPHFDPHLSSVYRFGTGVLDLFARLPDFNLIFAPHVMFWRKHLHVSLEYRTAALRPDFAKFEGLPNIRIDRGSQAAIDMTYTRAADVYLGDVSSQLYEFLARPRAAIFIDGHNAKGWHNDPNYQLWHAGPVVRTIADLEAALPRWREIGDEHRVTQQRLFADTFDIGDKSAAERGADALIEYLG